MRKIRYTPRNAKLEMVAAGRDEAQRVKNCHDLASEKEKKPTKSSAIKFIPSRPSFHARISEDISLFRPIAIFHALFFFLDRVLSLGARATAVCTVGVT